MRSLTSVTAPRCALAGLAGLCILLQLLQSTPRVLALPTAGSEELEEPEAAASTSLASYRALLPSSSLDEQLFQMTEKRQAYKYCGKTLANALHLVCKGKYNVPFKKSDPLDAPYWLLPPSPLDEEPKFPFRPRTLATAMMPGVLRRRTRGVYDECCVKGCSIKEMSSYCGGR